MKIGIVGTGPWAKTLSAVFRKQGHAIAAYDRASDAPASAFGQRVAWSKMPGLVDAVAIAAPPDITSEVASFMIASAVPTLATKPLLDARKILDHELKAPFFVDYVHLYSPIWSLMRERYRTMEDRYSNTHITFVGDGPVRKFSELYDYGSHALAMCIDLHGTYSQKPLRVKQARVKASHGGRLCHWIDVENESGTQRFHILTGNGAEVERRHVMSVWEARAEGEIYAAYEEQPKDNLGKRSALYVTESFKVARPSEPLSRTVNAFTSAIENGIVVPDSLWMSAQISNMFDDIEKMEGKV